LMKLGQHFNYSSCKQEHVNHSKRQREGSQITQLMGRHIQLKLHPRVSAQTIHFPTWRQVGCCDTCLLCCQCVVLSLIFVFASRGHFETPAPNAPPQRT
jgi:hypothetical protein